VKGVATNEGAKEGHTPS